MTSFTPTNISNFFSHEEVQNPFEQVRGQEVETIMKRNDNMLNFLIEHFSPISLADITALRAVKDLAAYTTSTTNHPTRNTQLRKVESIDIGSSKTAYGIYYFDPASVVADADGSSANADTDGIVEPTAPVTGRWIRIAGAVKDGTTGLYVHTAGAEAVRTMLQYLFVNLAPGSSDVFLKLAKRSAGSVVKCTSDAKWQLRNSGDSGFQDLDLKILTASDQIIQNGTPSASAILALFQSGSAPSGASASGNYRSINAAAAYAGTYDILQENGTTFYKILNSYAAATKAMLQLGADFSGLSASGQMQVINAPAAFAGYLQAWLVNNSVMNIIYSDGRMKGTAASNSDEFVTKAQMDTGDASSLLAGYGDGSDGTVNINSGAFSSGPITSNALTRDAYFTDLTLSGGNLNTAGFRLFVRGTLTINSTYKVHRDGNAGGAGDVGTNGAASGGATGAGGAGGTAGAALAAGYFPACSAGKAGGAGGNGGADGGGAGVNGSNGNNGDAASDSGGVSGTAGGAGGRGSGINGDTPAGGSGGTAGNAGTATAFSANYGSLRNLTNSAIYRVWNAATAVVPSGSAGSGSGSGAGGGASTGATGNGGGGGGGGGSGSAGGIVFVAARTLINNGTISANGGAGGNGGNGGTGFNQAGGGGGGGGGAGGSGGIVITVSSSRSGSGSITATGGTGGTGGTQGNTGTGGGAAAVAGANGTTGTTGVTISL